MLLFLALPVFVFAADEVGMKSSVVHLLQNFPDLQSTLAALPKECTKNGKTYKEGEEFSIGNLRYKCQPHGVYTIEGCVTDHKENLKIGEVVVKNNTKSQCLGAGSQVFYRETICGILGMPECDKVGPPKRYEEALKKASENTGKTKEISMPGLPPGWKVVDQTRQPIPGTNKGVLSHTLVFEPQATGGSSRVRRQTGRGVPILVAEVDVGTDKPPMPLSVAMGGRKITNATKESTTPTTESKKDPKFLYTQDVRQTLNIKNKNNENAGRERKDVNSRIPHKWDVKGTVIPEPVVPSSRPGGH
ncbi:unnamed protein product [Cylicocyclus nassatus]|uniref:Abnormal cell migration protein 18-like fibronectin type I domain-containing protein n=1 Tax=Cylicocyclus nassatus TaxID=53992 RepID=A0AA36H9M9_CYLNA|nr:unnamed protein product [Cylicocyclus nassatus]